MGCVGLHRVPYRSYFWLLWLGLGVVVLDTDADLEVTAPGSDTMNAKDDFFRRLRAVKTYAEAEQLVHDSHRFREPGQLHYSYLAWFLTNFKAPLGAGIDELQGYRELIPKFLAEGVLDEELLQSADRELQIAIKNKSSDLFPN